MELFIIRDGQQAGPFSESLVQTMLKEGTLHARDMAWHKGLAAWIPLEELLRGVKQHAEPPPVASAVRGRPASSRQKALLKYLGAQFAETITRDEAAGTISDAFENPKYTSRLTKWGEEKLRLHPDLFQEELDYRRANRITRFLELCQTDGADVVKDVTKAHVQVLVESLDKRQANWDADPNTALWDFLFPAISEHFPQLVRDEWKGRLKFGGKKVAAAYAGVPSTGILTPHAPASGGGAMQAAFRGIIYGLVALGVVYGAIHFSRNKGKSDVARNDNKPAAAKPAEATPTKPAETAITDPGIPTIPADPTNAAPIAAVDPIPAIPSVPATTPAEAPAPIPAIPTVPGEAPAPAAPMAANPGFTPAPPPPGETAPAPTPAPAPTTPAPAAPAGPVTRNSATLTQPITVQLQFGKVTLNAGTRLRLIAIEGQNVRVNFNNNIVLVPVASTDVDPANTVVAPSPAPVASMPVVPATPSVAPTTPSAPITPPAPKPGPSSDL